MTNEVGEDADPARGPRRLLALLVVLAIVAAGAALVLSLRDPSPNEPDQLPLFSAAFRDPTFLTGTAHLVASRDAAVGTRRILDGIALRTSGTVYVVARCDRGTIRVRAGALTSSRPCTGKQVGVVALQIGSPAQLTATVSAPQTGRWGIAVYR